MSSEKSAKKLEIPVQTDHNYDLLKGFVESNGKDGEIGNAAGAAKDLSTRLMSISSQTAKNNFELVRKFMIKYSDQIPEDELKALSQILTTYSPTYLAQLGASSSFLNLIGKWSGMRQFYAFTGKSSSQSASSSDFAYARQDYKQEDIPVLDDKTKTGVYSEAIANYVREMYKLPGVLNKSGFDFTVPKFLFDLSILQITNSNFKASESLPALANFMSNCSMYLVALNRSDTDVNALNNSIPLLTRQELGKQISSTLTILSTEEQNLLKAGDIAGYVKLNMDGKAVSFAELLGKRSTQLEDFKITSKEITRVDLFDAIFSFSNITIIDEFKGSKRGYGFGAAMTIGSGGSNEYIHTLKTSGGNLKMTSEKLPLSSQIYVNFNPFLMGVIPLSFTNLYGSLMGSMRLNDIEKGFLSGSGINLRFGTSDPLGYSAKDGIPISFSSSFPFLTVPKTSKLKLDNNYYFGFGVPPDRVVGQNLSTASSSYYKDFDTYKHQVPGTPGYVEPPQQTYDYIKKGGPGFYWGANLGLKEFIFPTLGLNGPIFTGILAKIHYNEEIFYPQSGEKSIVSRSVTVGIAPTLRYLDVPLDMDIFGTYNFANSEQQSGKFTLGGSINYGAPGKLNIQGFYKPLLDFNGTVYHKTGVSVSIPIGGD